MRPDFQEDSLEVDRDSHASMTPFLADGRNGDGAVVVCRGGLDGRDFLSDFLHNVAEARRKEYRCHVHSVRAAVSLVC